MAVYVLLFQFAFSVQIKRMRRLMAVLVLLLAVAALGETGKPRTDLNLRSAPSARNSRVITVLATSDRFEILEKRRGWYRVRIAESGIEGWVAKKYVRLVAPTSEASATEASMVRINAGGPVLAFVGALVALLLALVGYVSGHHPTSGNPHQGVIAEFLLSLVVGVLYIGLTLPKALIAVGSDRGWAWLSRFGEGSVTLNQRISNSVPDFASLIETIFWVACLYAGSLLVLAMRHGRLELFGWGLATLVFSISIFHVFAWAGYVAIGVISFVVAVARAIASGLARVLGAVAAFLWSVVVTVGMWMYEWLYVLLGDLWWVVPAGMVLAFAVALLTKWNSDISTLAKMTAYLLLVVSGAAIIIYGARWLWQYIGPWVMLILTFVGSAVTFLMMLLVRLALGLGILLALATIGQLLLDQIRGALSAGRGRRGVVVGALAIGTSIAILLLVSDVYGLVAWLPASVTDFCRTYLHQPAPLFDALIALGIAVLSIVGVWRNVPALGTEPTMSEFGKSLRYAGAGVVGALALAAVGTQTEE